MTMKKHYMNKKEDNKWKKSARGLKEKNSKEK